jgi:DNA polymerase I
MGCGARKMIDLQALTGDSVDNVPGVPGIGPKTAAQLMDEFGDLETLLARASEIKQNKRRENLIEHRRQGAAVRSELVRLDDNVPLDVGSRRWRVQRAGRQGADRFPEGDGIQHADPPRRRGDSAPSASRDEPAVAKPQTGSEAHGRI